MLRAFFAALVLVLLPLSAPAHAGWSTPQYLTEEAYEAYDDRTVLESNAAGDMIAAYLVDDAHTVEVRRMPRGANSWGPPTTFSVPDRYFFNLRGAIDNQGRACIAWESLASGIAEISAACYRPGAGWSSVKMLSRAGVLSHTPMVAITDGVATVVWDHDGQIAARRWVNGVWKKRKVTTQAGTQFAMDSDAAGRITLASYFFNGITTRVEVRTIAPNGAFGSSKELCRSSSYTCSKPAVAVNHDGTALVAWVRSDSSGIAEARHRLKNGKWGKKKVVLSGSGVLDIGITSNEVDNVFAVWTYERFSGGDTLRSTHRFANGTWSNQAQVDISSSALPETHAVAQMDSKRVVTFVWRRERNDLLQRARVLSDGETVQGAAVLSDPTRATPVDSDDISIAVRGKRQIHVIYLDAFNTSSNFRVSWVTFTP